LLDAPCHAKPLFDALAVMAAIVTVVVLWSGAHEEPRPGGHADSGSPPETRGGDWPGGGWWDGGGGGDGGGWGS
jgi:hypothetical protein